MPTKVIKGQEHKLCTGPGHDEPTWLPATDKYFYQHKSGERAGKLTPRCRLCTNWKKLKSPGESGLVPILKAQPFFIEAVNRVGLLELARRAEVSPNTIINVLRAKSNDGARQLTVQKRTLRKIMLQLISMRRKGEVRHRDSIHHGAAKRGKLEKVPAKRTDYYKPHGDSDTEFRRSSRQRATTKVT